MRSFLIFAVAITGLYLWQKHSQSTTAKADLQRPKTQVVSTIHSTPAPQAQPSVSEHNWMKRSLDRAADVANKSRNQTRDGQNP